MKQLIRLSMLLAAALFFVQCDDDDDNPTVPAAVSSAFAEKYPSVTLKEWDVEAGYYVAEFWQNALECDAWFTTAGEWAMTETDYGFNLDLLPDEVKTAYRATDYNGTWIVDDVAKYERPADEVFYLIEIEQGQAERKLFYQPDGTLIKDVAEAHNDDIFPTTKL